MRLRAIAAMLMILLASSSLASASPIKPITIGFGGGVSVPVSDAKDAFKSGWHGTGIVKFSLPGIPVDLSGALAYHRFKLDQSAVGFAGNGRILSGLGNATFNLPVPGPIKPYITAGLGAFNIKADPDSTGAPASSSTTKFGIDGGAGVSFSLFGAHGFIEGKIENIYTDQGLNKAVVSDFKTRIIPVTFGIFL